jgi:hypothetical protein
VGVHQDIVNLVPQLGVLHEEALWGSFGTGKERARAYVLEQLPYCLGACLSNLIDATAVQEEIIRGIDPSQFTANTEFYIPDEEHDRLSYRVDAFLESLVRAQNTLWPYLQYYAPQSLSTSFREIVRKISSRELSFSDTINSVILNYWQVSGERARQYRDLSQHFVVVPSDSRVLIIDGTVQSFFMPLPHNPETKNPLELRYNNDSPNAIPYLETTFFELVRTLRRILQEILGKNIVEPKSFKWVAFKEGSIGLPLRSDPPSTVAKLKTRIAEFRQEAD